MSVDPASEALASAVARAGVEIRTTDDSDLDEAREIFDLVWPSDGGSQVQPNLLRALLHAGGYCSVARMDGHPVAAAIGFIGRHRTSTGWEEHLHSHMAAVVEDLRDRHIGTAIKLHQRVWAREHAIPIVTWTFDPLVRRNARLNIVKLGVEVREFVPDFYGPMDDGINAGDPTDRLFAWWVVDSALADRAARGEIVPIASTEIDDHPDWRVIDLPEDIVALRATDPSAARDWRLRVREEIQDAYAAGLSVIGVTEESGYVLGMAS